MKPLYCFLKDAWWVFLIAAIGAIVMSIYMHPAALIFLPALVVVACYMSFVRYDSCGNLRNPDP